MPSSGPPLLTLHGAASVHHRRHTKLVRASCTCCSSVHYTLLPSLDNFSSSFGFELRCSILRGNLSRTDNTHPQSKSLSILDRHRNPCHFPRSFSYHYQHKFSFLSFGIFILLVQKSLCPLYQTPLCLGIKRPYPMDIKFGHVTSLSKEMYSEKNC